jgi:chromosome segregation ATPase
MRHITSLSLAFFFFLASAVLLPDVVTTSVAYAEKGQGEEAERGRLADGRAFRTDPEGNQLVDYIAELEVNLETLRTRVNGLEDEVKEKQSAIDRLRDEGRREAEVREKNLLASQSAAQKPVQAAACPQVTCEIERAKIQELSSSLELTKADLEVERQVSLKRVSETQSSAETLRASAENLQAKLASQMSDMEALRKELQNAKESESNSAAEVARLQGELGGLRLAAERAAQEVKSRTPVITSASVVTRAPATSASQETVSGSAQGQESSVLASAESANASSRGDARASLSVMRMRAVEVIRGKVRTQLNQVRGAVASRDDMFRRYGSKKRAVAFTPSRPVSASGLTLSEIAKKVQSAGTVAELSALTREVTIIEQKMNDDIALMRRMDRVK